MQSLIIPSTNFSLNTSQHHPHWPAQQLLLLLLLLLSLLFSCEVKNTIQLSLTIKNSPFSSSPPLVQRARCRVDWSVRRPRKGTTDRGSTAAPGPAFRFPLLGRTIRQTKNIRRRPNFPRTLIEKQRYFFTVYRNIKRLLGFKDVWQLDRPRISAAGPISPEHW